MFQVFQVDLESGEVDAYYRHGRQFETAADAVNAIIADIDALACLDDELLDQCQLVRLVNGPVVATITYKKVAGKIEQLTFRLPALS